MTETKQIDFKKLIDRTIILTGSGSTYHREETFHEYYVTSVTDNGSLVKLSELGNTSRATKWYKTEDIAKRYVDTVMESDKQCPA